ncbi:MAG: molybdopterin-guanine dinucleotide biosynthesis protein B [Fuerstiella sp.]
MESTPIEASRPKRVHVVGKKNSGKTTLVCELVEYLTAKGLSVATIKHTHHNHELDTTGKDSWQHRQAGATAVGILAAEMTAVFLPVSRSQNEAERYASLETALSGCDLILVEGDLHCGAPKLEVWRQSTSSTPYASTVPGINFVVTDDPLPTECQSESQSESSSEEQPKPGVLTLPRARLEQVADAVLKLAGG